MFLLILLILALLTVISAIAVYNTPQPGTRVLCGVLIIFLGLTLFSGIEYKNGETVVTTYNLNESLNLTTGNLSSTTTDQYETYDSYLLDGIALILLLLGVVVIFTTEEPEEYEEEED